MKLHLISDFNLETLGHCLANDGGSPQIAAVSAPFGQVFPSLLQPQHAAAADFALVWTSPEKIVPAFAGALNSEAVTEERLLAEVHDFANCLRESSRNFRAIFVVSWTLPIFRRGSGILSLRGKGLRKLLLKMNLALAEELESSGGIYLLDAQPWMEAAGKNAFSPKLWYLTKTPFHVEVFRRATSEIKAAVRAVVEGPRKLVVVDLDDTLWGGIVGDVGWQNLKLGGHDYLGEAYLDFQRALRSLRNRGILLAIASKNEESVALEAMARHPEMVLRIEDFAAYRINWNDKATNIADLAAELNLGLQSVVFIDDNPVERARVREALSEVLVPDWPEDKTLYPSRLLELDCFDSAYITAEDAARNDAYAAEKQRESIRKTVGSAAEWLLSLETEVTVEELNEANRVRVVQLMNKTNQMNLTTRRVSDQELQTWLKQGTRKLWAFRVKDKFGDSGLTGILGLEIDGARAIITDFVLSCRVMGRRVEDAMVAFAAAYGARFGLEEIHADYLPTAKNKPCLTFWSSSGFLFDPAQNRFTWHLGKTYPFPAGIRMKPSEEGESLSISLPQEPVREADGVPVPSLTSQT